MSDAPFTTRELYCVGLATLDLISLLPDFPDPNSRVEAEEMVFAGGGPAATAAVALARLGHRVEVVSAVGDDELGRLVLAGLKNEGVGIQFVSVVEGGRTCVSQVIVDTKTSERLIVTKPGEGIVDAVASFNFEIEPTWIHLDQSGYEALTKSGKRSSVFARHQISIDGGNPIEQLLLRDVDLYAPTIAELKNIFGADLDVTQLLQSALDAGAKEVVATDGANGSYSIKQGNLIHAKGFLEDTRSTLGAGDVFHGALLSGLVAGGELYEAMLSANMAALISCGGIDGRSSIPTLEELQNAINERLRSE